MKFSYDIYPKEDLVIEQITGEITIQGILAKTEKLFADPAYHSGLKGVLDLRKARSHLTKVELYGFADMINHSDKFGQSPWAIVADDPMVVALSQVFQQRLKDLDTITVVGSVEAAARFLQKPEVLEHLSDD